MSQRRQPERAGLEQSVCCSRILSAGWGEGAFRDTVDSDGMARRTNSDDPTPKPESDAAPGPAPPRVSRRALLAGLPAAALRAQERAPNLLVIVADDHGWNDLGCYGHPVARTPHLDRLAGDGVRFTHCYTTAPLCSPGRGAVMTGLYPHVSGVTRLVQGEEADRLSLNPDIWTFARGLRALGYECAAARKWHLSTAGAIPHGFDVEFPSRTTYLEQSVSFLDRRHDRPFCLYFCPTHTHRPYREHSGFEYTPDEVGECLPPYLKDTPQVRQHYAWYLSETSKMDHEIGQLLGALERSGEIDRTVVAFMTDHGPSMHRAKFSLYDWGTRSTLIFRGPGVAGSGRVDLGLASTVDIAPTLLSLAGGTAPDGCQGIDLKPRLADRGGKPREQVFSEHHEGGNHLSAVRGRRFKLIRNHTRDEPLIPPRVIRNWQQMDEDTLRQPYPLPRPPEELYDLLADPLESRSLADNPSYGGQLAGLRDKLDHWLTEPAN